MNIKEALVRGWFYALQDNPGAREQLFRYIWKSYYGRITAYTHNFTQTENKDIASDILLKVFEKLDTYNPAYPINPWIYRIARNHCIDHLRKKGSSISECSDKMDLIPGCESSPEATLLIKETREQVHLFLCTLPAAERETAYLKFFEELKIREIAEITGDSEGTVKYRLSRIREKLTDHWRNYEH